MGSMSASDAAPLPRLGEVFFDVRGSSRSMRLSWYSDTGVAVFSIWQGGTCTGTFRLPIDDLPRMVEALQRGPRGGALPAVDSRDLSGEGQRRGIAGAQIAGAQIAGAQIAGAQTAGAQTAGAQTDAMPAVASFPDYATGQHIAPGTGEFRSVGADGPSYRDDARGPQGPGSGPGGYPAYRDRERGQDSADASFPGYTDDGPPVYRDFSPPPAYRDDPLGGTSYRDDPLGSGGYRDESLPGHRDSTPTYRDDARGPRGPGPGSGSGGYPAYRERERGQDSAGASFPGYTDDGPPVYRDISPPPAYPDDPPGASAYRDDPRGAG